MAHYVDVYVLPVPRRNLEAYRAMAETAGKVWREYGAIDYIEVVGEDVKNGVHTSFPQAVKLEDDETVVVGWIVFRSREDRDRINAAVMVDPRLACSDPKTMPFDARRMFWGGFDTLVAPASSESA
jgi:uncharacterized protein YbaA (DUF1428 family)